MKRKQLVRYLRSQGCQLLREGGRYSWWHNPALNKRSSVPRYREINIAWRRRYAKISVFSRCNGSLRPPGSSILRTGNQQGIKSTFHHRPKAPSFLHATKNVESTMKQRPYHLAHRIQTFALTFALVAIYIYRYHIGGACGIDQNPNHSAGRR
jgi:mRNA interferase HicA